MGKMTAATVEDLHKARRQVLTLAGEVDRCAVAVARRHTLGNFARFQELRKLHATWCDIERTIRAQLVVQNSLTRGGE